MLKFEESDINTQGHWIGDSQVVLILEYYKQEDNKLNANLGAYESFREGATVFVSKTHVGLFEQGDTAGILKAGNEAVPNALQDVGEAIKRRGAPVFDFIADYDRKNSKA